jgi:hypothetical protein
MSHHQASLPYKGDCSIGCAITINMRAAFFALVPAERLSACATVIDVRLQCVALNNQAVAHQSDGSGSIAQSCHRHPKPACDHLQVGAVHPR